jgi:S-DNA-T family DNA segregation ATPase FtsK/SpoIIIE
VGGVVVAGLGLLAVVSVLSGGGPLLQAVRQVLLGLFGLGWIVPAGCAIGLGAIWIWPRPPALHPVHLLPGAIGVVTTLGVLSIASAPAGGEVGRLVATLVVAPAGRPGGLLILLLVTLASLIAALRFSLGSALVALVSAGRAAYAERRRLQALVRRRAPETSREGAPSAIPPEANEAGFPEEVPAPAPAPTAIWVPDHLEERALAQARLGARAEGTAAPATALPPEGADDLPVVAGEWDEEATVDWKLPPLTLLDSVSTKRERQQEEIKRNVKIIEGTLATFGVQARVIGVNTGPAVTQYELQPAAGVPVRRVVALQNDLSLALAAAPLRIEAPIPGKSAIGVEVPNKAMTLVTLREVVESPGFRSPDRLLAVALGNDVAGQPVAADLTRLPHLLIAGATGQGKSVCINALICSLLLQATPAQLRLVMVDPKRVELQAYNGLPHLVVPVIVEPHQAAAALRWAVTEMERRYRLLAQEGVRNLAAYNERARAAAARGLPYLVIVIDELADLMMVAAGEIEELICRIAQLARAVGIHLVIATQRPSTDIITGLIKANIPSRIAFAVGSQIDSRVILDAAGAEKLLGRGDMLYQPVDAGKPTRLQGTFISDREVEAIVGFWRSQGEPRYLDEVLEAASPGPDEAGRGERRLDPLFARAARAVAAEGVASVSLIQRKFNVGYSRAGRIVDQLAEHRVIGGYQGSKSREVLMTLPDVDELLERLGLEG